MQAQPDGHRPLIARAALATALCAITASGCTKARSTETPQAATYVKAIYSMPLTLDPAQMNDTSSLAVSNLIYDGLLSFTDGLEIRNELAESWTTSLDGKSLRFTIKKNAKFHDGATITTKDVLASFERLLSKDSKVFSYFDCIEGAQAFHDGKAKHIEGIRIANDRQFEIRLKGAFPPFISVLAGATAKILPQKAVQKDFFAKPVGSGAFRIEDITKTEIALSAFPEYAGPAPKLKKLILRQFDETHALEAAQAGLVHDLASFPLEGNEKIFERGQQLSAPLAATWIIGINTRLAPFKNQRVRQTFKQDFESEKFRLSFQPDSLSAHGYIPAGLPGFARENRQAKPAQAMRPKDRITVVIPAVLSRAAEMKLFIEQSMRQKGWNLTVELGEWDSMMKRYSDKSMQAFLVSMNMDYPDAEFLMKNFESANTDNFSGIKDNVIDRLISTARVTQDRIERHKLYSQAAGRIDDLAVTVNLLHPRSHVWAHPCVSHLSINLLADAYIDYRTVELSKECAAPKVASR